MFAQFKDKITRYIDVNVKLLKLGFVEHTSNILSYFIFAMIGLFIVCCILLFIGFGLTEGLVALGLPHVASFFITSGVYILLLLCVVGLRKSIIRSFANLFVSVMTENDDKGEEPEIGKDEENDDLIK